jgi:DNA-binding CsgD family transcriptional regulator
MDSQFEDFVGGLTDISDAEIIWTHTAEFAYRLGFSSCSLTLAKKTPCGLMPAYYKSNLNEEFNRAYKADGLTECDPFLHFICKSLAAQKVNTDNLSCFKGASAKHQAFLDHASESGAKNGIGIPVRPSGENVFGGWIFSSGEEQEIFNLLDKDHAREAHLAGVLAYERMVSIGLGQESADLLSARERECLLWLCAGYRVSLIADKLAISESAVNLYIANAKYKLGAKTREQAVARAIFSGEISI